MMICKSYITKEWIYSLDLNLIMIYDPTATTQILFEVEYRNKILIEAIEIGYYTTPDICKVF